MRLLNSPVEVGLRSVIVLERAFPLPLDLGRLVVLDHCVVHSELFGGPASLHPNRSNSVGELGLKRGLIESGLQIMRSAGLVDMQIHTNGIYYRASEETAGFVRLMDAPLVGALQQRAEWALAYFSNIQDDEVQRGMLVPFEALRNPTGRSDGNPWLAE